MTPTERGWPVTTDPPARFCEYRNGKFYWRRIRLPYWFARWFFDGIRK